MNVSRQQKQDGLGLVLQGSSWVHKWQREEGRNMRHLLLLLPGTESEFSLSSMREGGAAPRHLECGGEECVEVSGVGEAGGGFL
jgi:hypothetical protein